MYCCKIFVLLFMFSSIKGRGAAKNNVTDVIDENDFAEERSKMQNIIRKESIFKSNKSKLRIDREY